MSDQSRPTNDEITEEINRAVHEYWSEDQYLKLIVKRMDELCNFLEK